MNSLFKEEPKPPFSVSLNINCTEKNTKSLFNSIKNIFIKGLIVIQGGDENTNKLEIQQVEMNDIEKMKKYMLSMGLNLVFKTYNNEDKDYLYRNLLYQLEKIQELQIKITTDWKKDTIEKIHITVPEKTDAVKQYNTIIYEHFEANHFLKLRQPKDLRDYAIFITKKNITDVIYFDFAQHPLSYKCDRIKV